MIAAAEEREALIYQRFRPISRNDDTLFLPFQKTAAFGDTTFTLFYAWKKQFRYAYRIFENSIAVFEHGIDDRLCCILLRDNQDNIVPVINELYHLFQQAGIPLCFDYVCADDLAFYARAADMVGKGVVIRSNRDDSDYIYETEAFLSISGNRNKGKRGSLNALYRKFPDIQVVFHDAAVYDLRQDCLDIFDRWCAVHPCAACFYGCEKEAFIRFLEIFAPQRHRLAAGYTGGVPLCFAASEKVNSYMECYYFQKNAVRTRGLTYWLNREMALQNPDVKYINLGEDMGLPGLRTDKTNLHPCRCEPKFSVQIL